MVNEILVANMIVHEYNRIKLNMCYKSSNNYSVTHMLYARFSKIKIKVFGNLIKRNHNWN
jgi:hypothetical protein